jgi:Holliday junction resolvase-like predicted endonuclease
MLTENDVVDAVAEHLRKNGWHIERTRSTNERGHDILATKGETTLAVEVKGGKSSKPHTARYGKPFDSGQKRSHVAVALYKAATVFGAGQYRPGIALPSDDRHRKLIEAIRPALDVLHVAVFLADDDWTVREWL